MPSLLFSLYNCSKLNTNNAAVPIKTRPISLVLYVPIREHVKRNKVLDQAS